MYTLKSPISIINSQSPELLGLNSTIYSVRDGGGSSGGGSSSGGSGRGGSSRKKGDGGSEKGDLSWPGIYTTIGEYEDDEEKESMKEFQLRKASEVNS